MTHQSVTLSRRAALLAGAGFLTACGLPRSGPNRNEILAGSVLKQGDAYVLVVDDRINRIANKSSGLSFSQEFLDADTLVSDIVSPGDVLGMTIWENVDDGLLVPAGQASTVLNEIQVDGDGFIFIPYAGRLKVSGLTPEQIRGKITAELQQRTPEPQVSVTRVTGDGATVSVSGRVNSQGIFAIERPTRTLSAMLARAGGINILPETAQVSVVRGDLIGDIWYLDLFNSAEADIAVRAGDRIIVQEDRRSFTALGATGTQNRIPFDKQTISAIEALATVGGLSASTADPQGVFVFRDEPAEIANQLVQRDDLVGDQRIIYALNLTQPNGMFIARDFDIRDGDTVFVTEASFVQVSKVLAALTGSLNAASTLQNALNNLNP